MKIYEVPYAGWDRCLFLENNEVRLICTLEVGPRILCYAPIGGNNMFYEYPEHCGKTGGSEWRNYGGHRLWTSPEVFPRSYPADNEPINYEINGNTIVLTPPAEPVAQVQKQLIVTLAETGSRVTVEHRVTNLGAWPVKMAAWGISVTDKGGVEVIPEPTDPTGYLPTRKVALWNYSKMNDSRVYWGDRFITMRQDPAITPPFKLGVDGKDGWAAVFNHGQVFIKRFTHEPDAEYPDFGVQFESYVCGDMLECETLSPLKTLAEGETVTHFEEWELHPSARPDPTNEEEIAHLLKPYI